MKETSGRHWQETGGNLDTADWNARMGLLWATQYCIEPYRLVLKQAAGRSRFGAGRAEAEIARIRSAHAESPEYHGCTQHHLSVKLR